MNLETELGLEPHPEGGYFRRIHTAATTLITEQGRRHSASAIHYLLTAEQPQGRFHRVRSTILHFVQSGGPVQYACIDTQGQLTETVLGYAAGQALFLEVPASTWKCSRLLPGATHALVSEVVLPGFDWADHEYLEPSMLPSALLQQLQGAGWLPSER